MKLETFFEKFELFADAPDSLDKMRELVLELAVKGVLSERYPSDQEDPTWREFISKYDQRNSDSESDSQPPFEIPDAWRWTCLDDLGTTRVRNDVEDGTSVSFVPMALISSTYGVAAKSEERTWNEIKKGFTHFADGDVVVAKITPCFENAKSAVMRNLVNGVGAGTTELHVFRRGSDIVLPEFVLLYVKTRGFITRGEPRMTGSAGQKRVPREYFSKSPFPLPPIAEQKRIVAKVDRLMALCDQLEAQQKERDSQHSQLARASLVRFTQAPSVDNLNFIFHRSYDITPADLRKSILTLAVQGKLVPQDPKDEPSETLLKTIQKEKLALTKMGFLKKTDSFVQESSEAQPAGWSLTPLMAICIAVTDGDHLPPPKAETGIPFLVISNVRWGGINFESCRYVGEDYFHKLDWIRKPIPGDILYTLVGSFGIPVLVGEVRPFCVQRHIGILRPSRNVDRRYLAYALASGSVLQQVTAIATGIAQKTVPLYGLRKVKIPLPPLAEQRRIVAKVEQLMKLVDELEAQIRTSRASVAKLLDALVAELTRLSGS